MFEVRNTKDAERGIQAQSCDVKAAIQIVVAGLSIQVIENTLCAPVAR